MIKQGNHDICTHSATEFLGVVFGDAISWKEHIEYIKKNISKIVAIIELSRAIIFGIISRMFIKIN